MDKLKKIIYIVSGTLGIILMMFMLMHKVGLCAESNASELPLPYGPSSGIGYGDFPLTQSIIDSVVACGLDDEPTWFLDGYSLLIYEIESNYEYITFSMCGTNDGAAIYEVTGSNLPNIWDNTRIAFNRNKVLEIRYTVSSGSCSVRYRGSGSSQIYTAFSGHIGLDTGSHSYYVKSGEVIYGYPVAFSEGVDLTYNDLLTFYNSPPHSMGGGEGTITNLPNQEEMSGSPSSGDDTVILFGLLKGWLGTINNNNWAIAENQNDNMESFFKPYLDRIVGFTDWFFEPLDKEQLEDEFTSTEIYGLGSFVHSTGGDIAEFVTDGPPVPQGLHFDCQLHLLNKTFPFTVDFSWYENIKTQFLTVFLTFFYIGALIYFLKAIPSLLNGVSGQYNHIQEVSKKGDKK